ncbi:MAG: hypothetical protein LBU81_05095 [Methanosarcinales archaeon]|jgi:hypothetical protein|nr:hypothetical protein [Methanosarcinales archaeon]
MTVTKIGGGKSKADRRTVIEGKAARETKKATNKACDDVHTVSKKLSVHKQVGTGIDYSQKSQNMTVYSPFSGRKDVKH